MMRLLLAAAVAATIAAPPLADVDDFERPLGSRWIVSRASRVHVVDSADRSHGRVLALDPDGDDVYALIAGTEESSGGSLEGDVQFPTNDDNYLGLIYHFRRSSARTDFGVIYIKGNESYAQANPHYDFNVSRTLYPEFRVALSETAAIRIGEWQHFKLEVLGTRADLYVGDMTTPQMTFPLFAGRRGAFGFQPRSVGGTVWVDNIRYRPLSALSYTGPDRPALHYAPERLLNSWMVAGPMTQADDDVARQPNRHGWRPFATDARGAVVTGTITSFHGAETVAYFRAKVSSPAARDATLMLSTTDDLALWINGRFWWFVPRASAAWYDFVDNRQHAGQRIPIQLASGVNDLVVRVRGGAYATGGFFAAIDDAAEERMRAGLYADAVRGWDDVLRAMPADAPARADLENRRALYASLADVPPMTAAIAGAGTLRLERNRLGTWDAPVAVGGSTRDWIFDTGANLSTLTQSEATALGLTTRESGATVRGSTGAVNPVRIAVAPEIRIGPVRLTNVVFLVVSDDALHIGPLQYQIRGIIGIPVLRALGTFAVEADGRVRLESASGDLRAPQAARDGAPLAFDGWSPIVECTHRGQRLHLLLDTGANVSSLYPSARAALSAAELASLTQKHEQAGGAGGMIARTTEVVSLFRLTIGSADIDVRNVSLLPVAPDDESPEQPRDGVLGMDALRNGFAIDFNAMRLRVF